MKIDHEALFKRVELNIGIERMSEENRAQMPTTALQGSKGVLMERGDAVAILKLARVAVAKADAILASDGGREMVADCRWPACVTGVAAGKRCGECPHHPARYLLAELVEALGRMSSLPPRLFNAHAKAKEWLENNK